MEGTPLDLQSEAEVFTPSQPPTDQSREPDSKVWLREEAPADLASDLRWLCEEYMESHVVVDLGDRGRLETASFCLMLDLQRLGEESDCRLVLCGLSPHVKWQLRCVRLFRQFDTFDTRQTAIMALAPQEAY